MERLKINSEKTSSSEKPSISEEFEKLRKTEVKPTTRVVVLKLNNCCGCGCSPDYYRREVPIDSVWRNGDSIDETRKGDVEISSSEYHSYFK